MNTLPVRVVFVVSDLAVRGETAEKLQALSQGVAVANDSVIILLDVRKEGKEVVQTISELFSFTGFVIQGEDCFERFGILLRQDVLHKDDKTVFVVTTRHDLLYSLLKVLDVLEPDVCHKRHPLKGLNMSNFRAHSFPVCEIVAEGDGLLFIPFLPKPREDHKKGQSPLVPSDEGSVLAVLSFWSFWLSVMDLKNTKGFM